MSVTFPYLPTLPAVHPALDPASNFRPLAPVRIIEPASRAMFDFPYAVIDPGADHCVFAYGVARRLGVTISTPAGTTFQIRWRGSAFPLVFGDVLLELTDNVCTYQWPCQVAFAAAPIPYPILGRAGCLQFFDAAFRGARQTVELEANATYPGIAF